MTLTPQTIVLNSIFKILRIYIATKLFSYTMDHVVYVPSASRVDWRSNTLSATIVYIVDACHMSRSRANPRFFLFNPSLCSLDARSEQGQQVFRHSQIHGKDVRKNVIKQEFTYECHGHANFGTAEVHRGPGSENLSKGGVGFVQTHSRAFNSEYFRRDANDNVEIDLAMWYYDYAENVEPIQAWTQSGSTEKVASSEAVLDVS